MTRSDRPGRSRLGPLLAALDVVDLLAGSNLRHAGSVIVMMVVALIGFAVLFAVLGLTSVILVVFGLTSGPFAWLGSAILLTGVIGGFSAATIVMWKIIRRRPAMTVVAGFGEPDDVPDDGPAVTPSPVMPPAPMTADRMRALDSRLATTVAEPSTIEPPSGEREGGLEQSDR